MLDQVRLEIERAELAPGMPIKLVAIDGHGGAGKTVLAQKLAHELKAEILHTDDFASWDNPMDWWPELVEKVLEPIKSGTEKLNYPRGSWYENHHPSPVKDQPVTPVMILEGVSASRREFRPYLAYSIWVETPEDICLKRGIARDLENNEAGKSHKEITADWNRWHEYEDEYVERDEPQQYANKIVSGNDE